MKKGLYSIIYMFIVTLCFTSVVSGIRLLNEKKITTNMEARRQSVILDVLKIPVNEDAKPEDIVRLFNRRIKSLRLKNDTVYTGYDEAGNEVTGYALSVSGPGFWGPLSCMIGIDKDYSSIIGVNFYNNTETPGLGARITEPWFQTQFAGLPLDHQAGASKYFSLTQTGSGKSINEFDAITGATETSRAVEKLLNNELNRIMSDVIPQLREEI